MRVLVGAACVAIIAAVAYYFWSERQASIAQAAVNERAQQIALRQSWEKALYAASFASPGDSARVREYCRNLVHAENNPEKPMSKACRDLGYYP